MPTTPTPPTPLPYRSVPTGDVPATEVAIDTLGSMRRWGVLLQIVLYIYAGIGLLIGAYVGVIILINRGNPVFVLAPNLIIAVAGGVFGILALVGAIALRRFIRAAGATISLRRPEDLERALIALARFWRIATVAVIALAGVPGTIFVVGILVGAFP